MEEEEEGALEEENRGEQVKGEQIEDICRDSGDSFLCFSFVTQKDLKQEKDVLLK